MSTWIKTNKENYTIDEQYDILDRSTVLVKCKNLLMNIVKSHFDDISSEKEPLCLIINGVAGTGNFKLFYKCC